MEPRTYTAAELRQHAAVIARADPETAERLRAGAAALEVLEQIRAWAARADRPDAPDPFAPYAGPDPLPSK